jgi:hypothetical protein
LLQNTPLGPEDIARLVTAYEQTLSALDPNATGLLLKTVNLRCPVLIFGL